jgi:hypothetical protein
LLKAAVAPGSALPNTTPTTTHRNTHTVR